MGAAQKTSRSAPLAGGTVLVTGAASGIGAAAASIFAECGATLVLADRNAEGLRRVADALEAPHVVVDMDVASEQSVRDGFGQVPSSHLPLTGALLAAGTWRPTADGPLDGVTAETWHEILNVNLSGTFLTARAALAVMADEGSIVTVSSVAALRGWDKLYAYSASKGGVVAFTRVLAREGATRGIRVNCLAPGVVETPLTQETLRYSKPEDVPLDRVGRPEEIAEAALYLLSSGSSYIAGAVIPVDGGLTSV